MRENDPEILWRRGRAALLAETIARFESDASGESPAVDATVAGCDWAIDVLERSLADPLSSTADRIASLERGVRLAGAVVEPPWEIRSVLRALVEARLVGDAERLEAARSALVGAASPVEDFVRLGVERLSARRAELVRIEAVELRRFESGLADRRRPRLRLFVGD